MILTWVHSFHDAFCEISYRPPTLILGPSYTYMCITMGNCLETMHCECLWSWFGTHVNLVSTYLTALSTNT